MPKPSFVLQMLLEAKANDPLLEAANVTEERYASLKRSSLGKDTINLVQLQTDNCQPMHHNTLFSLFIQFDDQKTLLHVTRLSTNKMVHTIKPSRCKACLMVLVNDYRWWSTEVHNEDTGLF